MSSFIVFSASDYTVMSSDSLVLHGSTVVSSSRLSKLSVLDRDVYAVGIGDDNPVFSMLSQMAIDMQGMEGNTYEKVFGLAEDLIKKAVNQYPALDVKVALVTTRSLRHEEDVKAGKATSLTLLETASGFQPRHIATGQAFSFGVGFLDRMALNLFQDTEFVNALYRNAPTAASLASALHTFVGEIGSHVGGETNVLVVGEEGHTVVSGYVRYLPAQYLRPAMGVTPISGQKSETGGGVQETAPE